MRFTSVIKEIQFMRLLLFLSFFVVTLVGYGQESGSQKPQQKAPSSLDPYYPKEVKMPKKAKKKPSSGPTYESQAQFQARMEKTVKEKRKAEKEMMKPQYSDPMYFGHKRPPKKRKPGKMKFCKECGIRH